MNRLLNVIENWRPDLSSEAVVLELPARVAPYYQILEYCRHVGGQIKKNDTRYWVARVRRKPFIIESQVRGPALTIQGFLAVYSLS